MSLWLSCVLLLANESYVHYLEVGELISVFEGVKLGFPTDVVY